MEIRRARGAGVAVMIRNGIVVGRARWPSGRVISSRVMPWCWRGRSEDEEEEEEGERIEGKREEGREGEQAKVALSDRQFMRK